jgi:hypothetical protein
MKIALCLFGQPRYITDESAYNTHSKYIMKQGNTDVFTHFWFDINENVYPQSSWSYSKNLTVDSNTIDIISERYTPTKMEFEKQKDFVVSSHTQTIAKSLPNQVWNDNENGIRNLFNIMSQLYSIKRTLELCEEKIYETGDDYDFVILTRFDVIIHAFPDLAYLDKNKYYIGGPRNNGEYFPGWNDWVQIFGSKYIKSGKCYDNFNDVLSRCDSICIEEMKQIHFSDNFCFPKCVRYLGENILSEIKRS